MEASGVAELLLEAVKSKSVRNVAVQVGRLWHLETDLFINLWPIVIGSFLIIVLAFPLLELIQTLWAPLVEQYSKSGYNRYQHLSRYSSDYEGDWERSEDIQDLRPWAGSQ